MILLVVVCTLMPFIEGSGWPDPKCGRSLVRSRERFIYGGWMAKDGEFPWMVMLYIFHPDGIRYGCGGSIIKSDVVLTAAHCVPLGSNISTSKLLAGSLHKTIPGRFYQERKIKQVFIHQDIEPGFMPHSNHDMALVKLTRPFNFDASKGRIGTLCLALMPPRPGNVVTVAGWGWTSPNGTTSYELLAVTVPVMEDKFCMNMLYSLYLPKIMFCAGETSKRAAKGDSGGPAVVRSGRKSLQVGIASFRLRGNPHDSVAFTKISPCIKWIADVLKKLE